MATTLGELRATVAPVAPSQRASASHQAGSSHRARRATRLPRSSSVAREQARDAWCTDQAKRVSRPDGGCARASRPPSARGWTATRRTPVHSGTAAHKPHRARRHPPEESPATDLTAPSDFDGHAPPIEAFRRRVTSLFGARLRHVGCEAGRRTPPVLIVAQRAASGPIADPRRMLSRHARTRAPNARRRAPNTGTPISADHAYRDGYLEPLRRPKPRASNAPDDSRSLSRTGGREHSLGCSTGTLSGNSRRRPDLQCS